MTSRVDALLEASREGLQRVSPHDLAGEYRLPFASDDARVILFCNDGYASNLAAATLQQLGIARATDLVGGFRARHRLVVG